MHGILSSSRKDDNRKNKARCSKGDQTLQSFDQIIGKVVTTNSDPIFISAVPPFDVVMGPLLDDNGLSSNIFLHMGIATNSREADAQGIVMRGRGRVIFG